MPPSIARPSVASVFLQARAAGTALGSATRFVVERDGQSSLMTNWHVAAGKHPQSGAMLSSSGVAPDELLILHNKSGHLGSWIPKVERLLDAAGHPRWREHATHGHAVDVISLQLTDLADVEI